MSTDLSFAASSPAGVSAASPVPDLVPSVADAPPQDVGPSPRPVANLVFLTGTVTEPAEPRELAGGIPVVRWTLRVPRPEGQSGTDALDCVVLDADLKARALAWPIGLPVAVVGSVRRRFYHTGGKTATRVEIEVDRVTELDQPAESV
jgi:single-strand DNA-binding protein